MNPSNTQTKTVKKIGFITALIIVISSTIGAGIFLKNGAIWANSHYQFGWAIASWLVSAIGILALGIALLEIISTQRGNKSVLAWIERFTKKWFSKSSKHFLLWIYYPLNYFALPMYVITSIMEINPSWMSFPWYGAVLLAFFIYIFLSLLSMYSLKVGTYGQWGLAAIKFVCILIVPIMAFIVFDSTYMSPTVDALSEVASIDDYKLPLGFKGVGPGIGIFAAIPAIFFAYDGFYTVTSLKTNLKNEKSLGSVIVVGMMAITVAYLIISASLFGASQGGKIGGLLESDKYSSTGSDGKPQPTAIVYIVNVLVALAVLGILNGYTLGTYKVYDEAILDHPRAFSSRVFSKMSRFNITPGFIYSTAITLLYFLTLTFIGAFGFKSDGDYGDQRLNGIIELVDIISNWTSMLIFFIIGAAVLGGLINRRTNKVQVVRSKWFIPAAIIAIIFTFVPTLFMLLIPIIDLTNAFKPNLDPTTANLSSEVLVGLTEKWDNHYNNQIYALVVLIATLLISVVPVFIKNSSHSDAVASSSANELNSQLQLEGYQADAPRPINLDNWEKNNIGSSEAETSDYIDESPTNPTASSRDDDTLLLAGITRAVGDIKEVKSPKKKPIIGSKKYAGSAKAKKADSRVSKSPGRKLIVSSGSKNSATKKPKK